MGHYCLIGIPNSASTSQFVSQTIVYDPSHNVVKTHDSYRTMVVAFLFFQPIFHQRFSQRPNVTVKD